MTKPAIHEEIIQLLISTKEIFQSFSINDLKSIAGREAPPETNADKQVATYLAIGLSKIVPGHNIIVEDGEPIFGNSEEATWVIDPIDGTIPFMYHIPSYMVSIYALKNNVIQSAFAYNPNNGDVFYSDGKFSYCNDVAMKVSTKDSLVEARIALSVHAIETLPNLFSSLREAGAYIILQEGLVFRSLLVANGYIDATIQVGLKQFESGAVHSLVTNAGGQVRSSTQDNVEFLSTSPYVVISNSNLNSKIALILKGIVEKKS
jgi:myo-inositol-1(or 4)-monophosphatase